MSLRALISPAVTSFHELDRSYTVTLFGSTQAAHAITIDLTNPNGRSTFDRVALTMYGRTGYLTNHKCEHVLQRVAEMYVGFRKRAHQELSAIEQNRADATPITAEGTT